MPTSSSAAIVEKKKPTPTRVQNSTKSIERSDGDHSDAFLTIESALPSNDRRKLYKRSHSTLNVSSTSKQHDSALLACDPVTVQTCADGSIHVARTQSEKENHPDRISLDRRGLTSFPVIDGEIKLRLLSLQHNLINGLDGLKAQSFPFLVFLDIYDNQLDHLNFLNTLNNLRVLLIGKNRLRKIEGLDTLKKIEVLDLHGNQITHVSGLAMLSELKVLNLAGNQIRYIGTTDFQGLESLQELNLRRNRLKKLVGFGHTPNLTKLFISNNDLQSVEDISSLAKSSNLKEVSIDNNPVFLESDCVSFLVSYLPHLGKLNTMQITDQVRKAAMAWRRNKETTNSSFMDLTSDVCLNVRREEIISNARTNWELLRSQTRCLASKSSTSTLGKVGTNLNVDSDLILTSFGKLTPNCMKFKSKTYTSITTKVPLLNKKLIRTNSQDTDNSLNESSSNTSSNEFIRLPPILVPIIKKMEQKSEAGSKEGSIKRSGSLSSIGPNIDSSVSSLGSESSSTSSSSESEIESENEEPIQQFPDITNPDCTDLEQVNEEVKESGTDTASNISSSTVVSAMTAPSTSSSDQSSKRGRMPRTIKSALNVRVIHTKWHTRAVTAKPKKQTSPSPSLRSKDREQGGDYLIEICGRYLNVYGQCALRFIDKPWNSAKANDVNTVRFNYINFNGITGVLNKLKVRFPNIEHFIFKETNIHCLGQINALAEVQGLTSLHIDPEGNTISQKKWRSYAVYRLSHWGLAMINDVTFTIRDLTAAVAEIPQGTAKRQVVVSSAYSPGDENNPSPEEVKGLIGSFPKGNRQLILGCDANAHYVVWGSTDINDRAYTSTILSFTFLRPPPYYLKKLGKMDSEIIRLCESEEETSEHILSHCDALASRRLTHFGSMNLSSHEVRKRSFKITEEEVKLANQEYQSLSDLVLWCLPDVLLQPLLVRLRLDVSHGVSEQNAKKWLLSADPELKSVVSKEALQWKKGSGIQEDLVMKQKAKTYISQLLEEMSNFVNKLRLLDKKWPVILHEFVRNTLLDYSQLDMYMKKKLLDLMK